MLSIALDRFSAAEELGIGPTDLVVLEPAGGDDGVTSPVTLRPPSG
jgi:hypothetical protein